MTPIGRILNKFSKDLSAVETILSYQIGTTLAMFYTSLSAIIVASIAVQWVLIIIPFLVFLAYKLYKFAIPSYRETTRVESITKSPLLSFLAETCSGASTIRAFGKQKAFIKENMR